MRGWRIDRRSSLTRRGLLRSTAWPGLGALAAVASAARRGVAQTEVSKAAADYQDQPKDGRRCAGCRYFSAPDACRIVTGEISPDGWCRFWREA